MYYSYIFGSSCAKSDRSLCSIPQLLGSLLNNIIQQLQGRRTIKHQLLTAVKLPSLKMGQPLESANMLYSTSTSSQEQQQLWLPLRSAT
jgi:hypothetical protein